MNYLQILTAVTLCVAMATAQPYIHGKGFSSYYRPSPYDGRHRDYYASQVNSYETKDFQRKKENVIVYQEGFKGGRYYYGGHYKDKCYQDGLYFLDDLRFVYCSNGNPYIQPCAPGSRNSGDGSYKPGYYYGYSDFCNINLVDYGYGPEAYKPYASDTSLSNKDGYNRGGAYKVETKSYERSYGSDDTKNTKDPLPGAYNEVGYPDPSSRYPSPVSSGKATYVKETRSYETDSGAAYNH